jgi:filamentous hemagglutinin
MSDRGLRLSAGHFEDELPGHFVPEGAPVPPELQGPDWLRLPAQFVPEGMPVPAHLNGADWVRVPAVLPKRGSRRTTGGQPWPKDRNGQDWPNDRLGRPMRPLWDYPPGVRAPGEGPFPAPAAPYRAVAETIADTRLLLEALNDPGRVLRELGVLPPQGQGTTVPPTGMPASPADPSRRGDGAVVAQEEGGKEREGEEVRRELEHLNRGFPGHAEPHEQGERIEPLRPEPAGGELRPPKLAEGKQDKPVLGSNNYDLVRKRSILTCPDPQSLVNGWAGKGRQVGNIPVGQAGSKERVDFGFVIGNFVEENTGVSAPTTKGIIIYDGKGRAHIVPARP